MAATTAAIALTVGGLAAGQAAVQYTTSRRQEKLQKRALNQAQDAANREEARQLKQEQAIAATESRALKQQQGALSGLRQGARGSKKSLLSGAETGLRNLLG